MPAELIAVFAAVSYALFTVYGWFGLNYSSALVATLVSLASRTIMLWMAVVFTGGIPQFAPQALGICRVRSSAKRYESVDVHRIAKDRHCSEPAAAQYLSAVEFVDCD